MEYNAVLENYGKNMFFVIFNEGRDHSWHPKPALTKVNFSDDRTLAEIVREFNNPRKGALIKGDDKHNVILYPSEDSHDVLHFFTKYFAMLSDRNKTGLWIQC